MKFSFEDENIDVSFKVEGLSKELKAEIFSTIYNSIKLEHRSKVEEEPKEKKEKTEDEKLLEKFKEGYNALPKGEDTFHYPESEFEKDKEKKPPKSKAVSTTKQKYEKKRPNRSASNTNKPDKPEDYSVVERKVMGDKKKLYQLWYVCPAQGCFKKGKQFVEKGSVYVDCESCGKRMNVRYATDNGFGEKDDYGNYYIAGKFERNYNAIETLAGTAWN